jgi:hypothetical protein
LTSDEFVALSATATSDESVSSAPRQTASLLPPAPPRRATACPGDGPGVGAAIHGLRRV